MPPSNIRSVECPNCGNTVRMHVGRLIPPQDPFVCFETGCTAVFSKEIAVSSCASNWDERYLEKQRVTQMDDPPEIDWDEVDSKQGSGEIMLVRSLVMVPSITESIKAKLENLLS